MLGYPDCCREFFEDVWVRQKHIDTTWQMHRNTKTRRTLTGPNILLRWLGIRSVPHLPCSFDCEASDQFGAHLRGVGMHHGFEEEMRWLEDILHWPVEWSALHGIAEIKTPVLKISTRTDATADKLVIQREGKAPPEGARGERFPYVQSEVAEFMKPDRAADSRIETWLARDDARVEDHQDVKVWSWQDNGFASLAAQRESHRVIKEAASEFWELGSRILQRFSISGAGMEPPQFSRQLSPQTRSAGASGGVDVDAGKIERARSRYQSGHWQVGDMFEVELPEFALIMLMPGRLKEVGEEKKNRLLERLGGRRLLVYLYGDWLRGEDPLQAICEEVGLAWNPVFRDVFRSGTYAQAAIIDVGGLRNVERVATGTD